MSFLPVDDARIDRRVRSIDERAAEAGIHGDTLRDEIARGVGPIVTRLSPRRLGIREDHWTQWLNARAKAPAVEALVDSR